MPNNQRLVRLQRQLRACRACPDMQGQPVHGTPVNAAVMLVGQAPGIKEADFNRPFAWTAGKTLFQWFGTLHVDEERFRRRVYMAAVCRCFPGKHPKAGDRVPDRTEIHNCARWLRQELTLIKPQLIIPVGKLAISQFVRFDKLTEVIGQSLVIDPSLPSATAPWPHTEPPADLIPLPHPSGASTWHRTEPGKTLLQQALRRIAAHPAWATVRNTPQANRPNNAPTPRA